MIRFYLIPMVTVVRSESPYSAHRGPKYIRSRSGPAEINCKWTSTYYGLNDVSLVRCDLTKAQHDQLKAYSDVMVIPRDISKEIKQAGINAFTPLLEAHKIPADWITETMSYKQVLRRIYRIFHTMKLFHGRFNRNLFKGGKNNDNLLSDYSQKIRQEVRGVARELGVIEDINNSMKIRKVLRIMMKAQTVEPSMRDL